VAHDVDCRWRELRRSTWGDVFEQPEPMLAELGPLLT
jgi:hypothetical protein